MTRQHEIGGDLAEGRSRGDRRLFKTADVVKRSGFTRQMIYTYTTMGLIAEAQKTPTGHKLYDESVFTLLKLIHHLHERGYTLRDIKQIFFK
jgi:DNA-binding transcriptional MerR regulator